MKKFILALVLLCWSGTAPRALDVSAFSKFPITKGNEAYLKAHIVDIFTLKTQRWPTGEKLQVFIMPKASIYTKIFTQKYLKMTPERYYALLAANQAANDMVPIVVDNQSELVLRVLNTRGSIGYADSAVLLNLSNRIYSFH
jgi:hypothetical protein